MRSSRTSSRSLSPSRNAAKDPDRGGSEGRNVKSTPASSGGPLTSSSVAVNVDSPASLSGQSPPEGWPHTKEPLARGAFVRAYAAVATGPGRPLRALLAWVLVGGILHAPRCETPHRRA